MQRICVSYTGVDISLENLHYNLEKQKKKKKPTNILENEIHDLSASPSLSLSLSLSPSYVVAYIGHDTRDDKLRLQ